MRRGWRALVGDIEADPEHVTSSSVIQLDAFRETPVTERLPTVDGGWGTIVADPAWNFGDKGSRATPDYLHHSPMDLEDIVNLPVRAIAGPKSHLYLWVPDTHLDQALVVADRWGFVYKHLIIWTKMRVISANMDGKMFRHGPLQIGMGHYYRKAHEVCLFCTRGQAPARVHNLPSVIIAPRGRHSAKPEELQNHAELLSPGPYLELFARRQRPGWTVWGNECESG